MIIDTDKQNCGTCGGATGDAEGRRSSQVRCCTPDSPLANSIIIDFGEHDKPTCTYVVCEFWTGDASNDVEAMQDHIAQGRARD